MTGKNFYSLYILAIWVVLLSSDIANAQPEQKTDSYWRAGLYAGPFLPSNFSGMDEILKGFGGSFCGRDPKGFGFEAAFFRASEDAAVLNVGMGRILLELPIPKVNDVYVLTFVGIQALYYRRPPDDGVNYPYAQSGGIHAGGGVVVSLRPGLDVRSQFSIHNGPGRSLLVEVGVEVPL